MANVAGKLTMKVLTVAVGIPIGIVTKKVVARTWAAVRPQNPNRPVNENEVRWGDAIGYAALASGAAVAAKLITRKGAEQTYRTLIGLEPPPPPPTKAQKKLAKAQQAAAE
ncbi:MAG TPA: DUF4235 domain-containing protein [Jatrophihabitantaceae bacterium]|jgi:hypothetical protein|nr:DUF4235 domain-containing protein [Jatrophihabitantaceae bacterium]